MDESLQPLPSSLLWRTLGFRRRQPKHWPLLQPAFRSVRPPQQLSTVPSVRNGSLCCWVSVSRPRLRPLSADERISFNGQDADPSPKARDRDSGEEQRQRSAWITSPPLNLQPQRSPQRRRQRRGKCASLLGQTCTARTTKSQWKVYARQRCAQFTARRRRAGRQRLQCPGSALLRTNLLSVIRGRVVLVYHLRFVARHVLDGWLSFSPAVNVEEAVERGSLERSHMHGACPACSDLNDWLPLVVTTLNWLHNVVPDAFKPQAFLASKVQEQVLQLNWTSCCTNVMDQQKLWTGNRISRKHTMRSVWIFPNSRAASSYRDWWSGQFGRHQRWFRVRRLAGPKRGTEDRPSRKRTRTESFWYELHSDLAWRETAVELVDRNICALNYFAGVA